MIGEYLVRKRNVVPDDPLNFYKNRKLISIRDRNPTEA